MSVLIKIIVLDGLYTKKVENINLLIEPFCHFAPPLFCHCEQIAVIPEIA